ncbi:retropepsin-like aspartic protease [Okeanomitos corallinicola TIOX110]|uniref:Retropepsin-like aspartic protease n=1 Tax=Okeanomitos corallinicola TIOX110 TaxID=3133117 RepID=A0ABZ2UVP0_9CYAN
MLESFLSRTALIFISGSLAVFGVACSNSQPMTKSVKSPQPSISQSSVPQSSVPSGNLAAIRPPLKVPPKPLPEIEVEVEAPPAKPSPLQLALEKANGAEKISQSAQSPEDWELVASKLENAIALLQDVKRDSPNFPFAQNKIAEYEREIQLAIQRANPSQGEILESEPEVAVAPPQVTPKPQRYSNPVPMQSGQTLPPPQPIFPASEIYAYNHQVFIAPIKRRIGGTPIVEVTLNGKQRFEMIVDTGASGSVITQEVADALGIVPVGTAKANTVSSKGVEFPVGYLDSMEVGGVKVNKIPVAIAGKELETGLLGHDFFGDYDVTIKRNVIEFRPQTHSEANPSEMPPTEPTSARGFRFVESPSP